MTESKEATEYGQRAGRRGFALLAAALLAVGCHRSSPVEDKPAGGAGPAQLIELPNGTIAARPDSPEAQMARFLASKEPAPRTFRFAEGQFAPWSAHPNPQTLGTLAAIGQVLRQYPKTRLLLRGYTDNVGSAEANRQLSADRVGLLKQLLVREGVPAGHIETQGFGMADPIADNATEQGRARNRRVEIIIVAK